MIIKPMNKISIVKNNSTEFEVVKNIICPICKNKSVKVKYITVKNLVNDSMKDTIIDKDYYICMNRECDVVYFNESSTIIYTKDKIKVPIWFKKGADPKYACYCSKVTEHQIIDAVVNQDAKTVKDIIKITGAMKNSDCVRNNPLGKCCQNIIKEAIEKALLIKEEKK